MSNDPEVTFLKWMIALLVGFLGFVFFVAVPRANDAERRFVESCTQAGGVPSKYETMVGKTSHSERLCIKKENIVEIGK